MTELHELKDTTELFKTATFFKLLFGFCRILTDFYVDTQDTPPALIKL